MRSPPPTIDDGVRRRLTARFGAEVGAWFDELPAVLSALAERWQVELGSLIPRGSVSVVVRCQMSDGRPAVLKVSPDRTRLAYEAAALDRWTTVQTPSVLAVDESAGALLLEAIDPAPCLGDDVAFDAIDLLLWQADDVDMIAARVEQLAPTIDVDAGRLLDWCIAFAAMTALELAEAPDSSPERIAAALTLA